MTGRIASSSTNSSTNCCNPRPKNARNKRPRAKLCCASTLFSLCLCAVAAALGYAAYFLLRRSEEELAAAKFEAIAVQALHSAQTISLQKRNAVSTLGAYYANGHPNAKTWPFVVIDGFDEIADNVIQTKKDLMAKRNSLRG